MSSRTRFLLPLAALCLAPSAHATDLAYVKCAVNQDRVWVYESLGSFDVETRLRCGAPVEILSRVKGFVKIRTESGVEGFVADGAFPDLPPLADDSDKPAAAAQSLAAAAAQRQQAAKPAPVAVAANPPAVAPAPAPMPTPAPAVAVVPVKSAPMATAPAVAAVPQPTMVATAAPAVPAPAPVPVKATTAARPASSSLPAPPAPTAKISTASAKTKPAPAATTKRSDRPFDSAPAAPLVHSAPAAPPAPSTASAKPSVETVSDSMRDTATYVPATAMTDTKAASEDSDEYPDTKPQNESADPACRVFFAAYGLAPSQYKWFAEDRRKEFSGICPAPDVAHVDYVVLFTHDSDTYNYALPVPVHTDHNGFSDFSALTTVDTALMTASEVQKARYEFVWVFRVKRGDFDPARFSPRRKPQFTTYVKGSRAPARAIEDAFNFVQTQGDH